MKWRLYEKEFRGAGKYHVLIDSTKIPMTVEVDDDGVFEFSGEQTIPLYAIAAVVGGKRDIPYSTRK